MPRDRASKRAWCFTVNNYTDANQASLRATECRYIIFGREVGESGTPHLQGYVEFANALTLAGAKRRLGIDAAHLEPRRGTPIEAATYCRKDGDFEERGELPNESGRRRNYEQFTSAVTDLTQPMESVASEFPGEFMRYHRGATELRARLSAIPRSFKTTVIWLWGPTGVGKSRMAQELYPGAYWKPPGKWWDGYVGQPTVVLDDLRGRDFEFNYLLRLLDRYPLRVEYKGGSAEFAPKTIFITSCTAPNASYSNDSEDLAQLQRRVEKIVALGSELEYEAVLTQLREFLAL